MLSDRWKVCTLIRVKRTIRHGGVGGESWMYYVSTSLWGNSRQNCHKVSPRGLDLHHWLCSSQKPTQFSLSFFFFFFLLDHKYLFKFYFLFTRVFDPLFWRFLGQNYFVTILPTIIYFLFLSWESTFWQFWSQILLI